MPCRDCPAAFVIEGATRADALVLCRVESSARGQADEHAGPVSRVRARSSPASFHGYCRGRLAAFVEEVDLLGALANPDERAVATAARISGAAPAYTDCPSWRAEFDNRHARKLVDLPNTRRRVLRADGETVAA